jgi:hypothetical protein
MAVLALILASSLNQAAAAPDVRVVITYSAPWAASACKPQLDAKFVHIPKPAPTLQTVHVTQGEATACLQRGPDRGSRLRSATPVTRDPQAPPP